MSHTGSLTTTNVPLSEFHQRFPGIDLKFNCVEVREQGSMWQRIKAIQQRTSPRGHSVRRMRVVLHTPNWENNGAKPIRVFWSVEKMIDVRITRDASAATYDHHPKFTLSDTEDEGSHTPVAATTIIEEIGSPDLVLGLTSLQLDPDMEAIRKVSRMIYEFLRTSTMNFCPADILKDENSITTLSRLYLNKIGCLNTDLGPCTRENVKTLISSADVFSIVEAMEDLNLTVPFLKLSAVNNGAVWYWPHANISIAPKVTAWQGLSRTSVIELTKNVILSLVDVFIQQHKQIIGSEAPEVYASTHRFIRSDIADAFTHNGDSMLADLEQHIRNSSVDNTEDEQMIDPWTKDDQIHFQDGVLSLRTEKEEGSNVIFTGYENNVVLTRYLPWKYTQQTHTVCTPQLFADPEVDRFVFQVLASCLFAPPAFADSDKMGAAQRTILVLEVTDEDIGTLLKHILCTTFGPYLLECNLSDNRIYYGVYPGDNIENSQPVDMASHGRYRIALTDLTNHPYSDIYNSRFDIAYNLGAAIPHVVIGRQGVSTQLNVASHDAPYVAHVVRSNQTEVVLQSMKLKPAALISVLIGHWQQDSNLHVTLLEQIPRSIQQHRAIFTWFGERAIVFVTERIVRDEQCTLTVGELTEAFQQSLIQEDFEAPPPPLMTDYRTEVKRYRFLAYDNFLRLGEAGDDAQHPVSWKSFKLLKPLETRPRHAHLLGSVNDRYFETMYHQHHRQQHPKQKPISRNEFFKWCKRNGKQTAISDTWLK